MRREASSIRIAWRAVLFGGDRGPAAFAVEQPVPEILVIGRRAGWGAGVVAVAVGLFAWDIAIAAGFVVGVRRRVAVAGIEDAAVGRRLHRRTVERRVGQTLLGHRHCRFPDRRRQR